MNKKITVVAIGLLGLLIGPAKAQEASPADLIKQGNPASLATEATLERISALQNEINLKKMQLDIKKLDEQLGAVEAGSASAGKASGNEAQLLKQIETLQQQIQSLQNNQNSAQQAKDAAEAEQLARDAAQREVRLLLVYGYKDDRRADLLVGGQRKTVREGDTLSFGAKIKSIKSESIEILVQRGGAKNKKFEMETYYISPNDPATQGLAVSSQAPQPTSQNRLPGAIPAMQSPQGLPPIPQ